jgi:dipeptidyl aminopeptidase/acylaminoacyl peptidase
MCEIFSEEAHKLFTYYSDNLLKNNYLEMIKRYTVLALLLGVMVTAWAQSPRPELTVKMIMQDPKTWIGTSPSNPFWSEDGKTLYFSWNPDAQPGDSLYKVGPGGKIVPVSRTERNALPLSSQGVYNKARTKKLYTKNGDIYLFDIPTSRETRLTHTNANESSPAFASGEQEITFVSDNNLYLLHLSNGTLRQLTDFKTGKERKDPKSSDQDEWLRNDQLAYIEVLRQRKETTDARRAVIEANRPSRPKTIYLDNKRVVNLQLSPDRRYITYTLSIPAQSSKNTDVPNFVTESGYTENLNSRPKVGSPQSGMEVGIYDLQRDTTYLVNSRSLPGLNDAPDFASESAKVKREVITHTPLWSPDGNYVVVSFRSHDNKDRWIALLDPATGEPKLLDRQRDDAWVAGPGIGWSFGSGDMGWMPDNRSLWFQSEESGYSHLYTVDVVSGAKKALTQGKFEVYSPRLSKDKTRWYFEANREHPGVRHFYTLPLQGGTPQRLTQMEGRYDAILSPDESRIALLFSTSHQPTELYLTDNPLRKKGAKEVQLTESVREGFKTYPWREAEVTTFKAADGADVYARIYHPAKETKNGAAVVFVHGAGYLQNAHKWWSTYFREYMFHNLLADKGYTVLDIDYRGSAGYGRDWRTGIYRHMGGKDLSDHVDGAKFLVSQHGIDPTKIGIYGGSYGGFITLMAMFTEPDVFAAGAALRSVTDWAHYNHGYTSNILNTPVDDEESYRKSSPIYYAEGLKGALLICHGMIDTNVHFQDVVRLAQRLIELEKDNWEMAVYPLEDHGFVEPSSWTDEYKRILKLFEDNLK